MTADGSEQMHKALKFRALHDARQLFIMPNPWDEGSARLFEGLGFSALASTSAGIAFARAGVDNSVSRQAMLDHLTALCLATSLPVSADLAQGFGDAPDTVAETIMLAAQVGIVGGSIEDASGRPSDPIYRRDLAVERVRAAAETARKLPFPFTLTARAENYLVGRPDLADTIARLQAYQDAGADVLYAPGLTTLTEIATVVSSVDCPVNVLLGRHDPSLNLARLREVGVVRVSLGSALARVAYGAAMRAAWELAEHGTFGFLDEAMDFSEITARLEVVGKIRTGR